MKDVIFYIFHIQVNSCKIVQKTVDHSAALGRKMKLVEPTQIISWSPWAPTTHTFISLSDCFKCPITFNYSDEQMTSSVSVFIVWISWNNADFICCDTPLLNSVHSLDFLLFGCLMVANVSTSLDRYYMTLHYDSCAIVTIRCITSQIHMSMVL